MPNDNNDRQRRLAKNSLYGLLSWVVPLFPTFVVTPIVVHSLGNELYGVYVVILGFISYFFTFGIGKAAAKYVAEYRATGETEKISDIISSTVLLSFVLGIVGLSIISIFAKPIVSDLLLISEPMQETAVLAIYLACANILVTMIGQIFQFVLQGIQRFDRFLLLTNLNSLMVSVGSVILALNGFGILALLIWTLTSGSVVGVISLINAVRLMPDLKFRLRVSSESWNAVWRYAASIIAYQVFGNILLIFERGWIMRKFGAEALTFYVVPMTLGMYIHLFTSSLVLALFPMVNELLLEKDKLIRLYKKSTKLILTLVIFALVSAIVCGRIFLGIWMNNDFSTASYWLLVIHVLTFSLLAMMTIVWQITESFRFASLNAVTTFSWMMIAIPLMVILSTPYGPEGIALARFFGVLVFVPMLIYVERKFLGGVFVAFWSAIISKTVIAGLLTAGVEYLILTNFNTGWITFFVAVAGGSISYFGILLVLRYFDDEDKAILRRIFVRGEA